MTIARRTLLHATALAPLAIALGACRRIVPRCPNDPYWSTPDSPLTIDAHSHVFNATDLQVKEFVTRVAARQGSGGLARLAKYFGAFVQFLGWNAAPDAAAERRLLERIADGLDQCPDPTLAGELATLRQQQYQTAVGQLKTAAARVRAQRSIATLQRQADWEAASDAEKGVRAIEEWPDTYDRFLKRRAARQGPLDVSAERKSIDSAIAFLVEMFQYRYGSVFQLLDTYNTPQCKLDLMIAHLVDYDWWLNGGQGTPTGLRDQTEIMSSISVLTGGRVHAFVPFCPLREVQHRRARSSTFSSLEFVQWAVKSRGAVGVKLYPPMGFAPLGNSGLDELWKAADWLPPTAHEAGFGGRLDQALSDFYHWCVDEDVPVMAHANPSNGPSAEFEKLAGPDYWKQALDAFPRLRVSFGHFGAVTKRSSPPNAESFLALMAANPNEPGSRAYADSGYFSEALDQPKELEDALVALFQSDAQSQKTLLSRFMLGSDWKMLVLEDRSDRFLRDLDLIIDRVALRLAPLGDYTGLKRAFTGRNAAEFLGLHVASKSRERMQRFYADSSVKEKPTWAVKVDREP